MTDSDDRVEIVWDYKTSKQIYREHKLQTTAYRDMAVRCGIVSDQALAGVMLIDKTGTKRKLVKVWLSDELYNEGNPGILTQTWQNAINLGNSVKSLDAAKIW